MKDVQFRLNYRGGQSILKGNAKMITTEMNAMAGIIGTIRSQFFQQFGFEGKFEMEFFTTDRSSVKITAADARTAKTLQSYPKWMAQFLDNIVV